jgi:hypothetical protein
VTLPAYIGFDWQQLRHFSAPSQVRKFYVAAMFFEFADLIVKEIILSGDLLIGWRRTRFVICCGKSLT